MVLFGTNRPWLTLDWGETWNTLPTNSNPYASGGVDLTQDVLDGSNITAVAIASANRCYAATQHQVWQLDKDKTTGKWTSTAITTTGLDPGIYITAIAVKDAAAGTFYIAAGFGGVEHVWFYDGKTWNGTGLKAKVDCPAHAIVVDPAHPNNVYAGTDVGVWRAIQTGQKSWDWTVFSWGLPEAVVLDLKIHQKARLLRASTYGRGLWEIPLDVASTSGPDIYLRANYADTGRMSGGRRYPWVDGGQDPTDPGFNVYHWMSADIKVRRGALPGLPPIGDPANMLDFAVNVGDYVDPATDIETADLGSVHPDQIYVEVHNRGHIPIPGSKVQVLLLLTPAAAGLPPLPADYAVHIVSGDRDPSWLGADWFFAEPANPYRTLPGDLSARNPQVVSYVVDFVNLSLPPGADHVSAAAFVTTPGDPLTATNTSLDELTMTDKHVALRNLNLVLYHVTPPPPPPPSPPVVTPPTFLLDFHNATPQESTVDLVFQRRNFSGHLSVVLPKLESVSPVEQSLQGMTLTAPDQLDPVIQRQWSEWLASAGKLQQLDGSRVFVAASTAPQSSITGVRLPAPGRITAAITAQPPPESALGKRYRFDVTQSIGGRIVGGSSCVLAVVEARPREPGTGGS